MKKNETNVHVIASIEKLILLVETLEDRLKTLENKFELERNLNDASFTDLQKQINKEGIYDPSW